MLTVGSVDRGRARRYNAGAGRAASRVDWTAYCNGLGVAHRGAGRFAIRIRIGMTVSSSSIPASFLFPDASYCARTAALTALLEPDPARKAALTRALYADWQAGRAAVLPALRLAEPAVGLPGRPVRPELVEPRRLARRSMQSSEGRATMLHAIAHIEFNAINLALDAVWRFAELPLEYYGDWLKVASEEAYHFGLLSTRLADFERAYGDFPAHDGLWEMCERTARDALARMALVPRTLEARGLDASPPIRARLAQAGDIASAEILDIILRDEIGHVRIGNRWFRHLCAQAELDPLEAYAALAERYHAPRLRGPFNLDARRAAGFDEAELDALERRLGAPDAAE
jgi:uncharacterized ferritin-like protein (DUF455 family)